jgi:hypothetical protein
VQVIGTLAVEPPDLPLLEPEPLEELPLEDEPLEELPLEDEPLDELPLELPADDSLLPLELALVLPPVPPLPVAAVDLPRLDEEPPLELLVVGVSGVPEALQKPPSPHGKMSSGPTLRQPTTGRANRGRDSHFISSRR